MSELYKKLRKVQQELKVPKNQYNDFGGYSFRSCEDILEAAKPILAKYDLAIRISDEVVVKGDRNYIKATVMIMDTETGDSTTNSAFAREAESKKGMDPSQITGAASSYARKYALNGIFAIDDTKDADVTNKHNSEQTKEQIIDKIRKYFGSNGTHKIAQQKVKQGLEGAGLGDDLKNITKLDKENLQAILSAIEEEV